MQDDVIDRFARAPNYRWIDIEYMATTQEALPMQNARLIAMLQSSINQSEVSMAKYSTNQTDCYLRQSAGGTEFARNRSRTWFLR